MLHQNEYRDDDRQELIQEDFAVVWDEGKYVRIDWYAVDSHPEESWYDTDLGPCPKNVMIIGGISCVRTDFSILSKS